MSPEDFDRRSLNPIIPISFSNGVLLGGSINLRNAEYISPSNTGKLLMLCHKWGMPLFDKSIADSDSEGKLAMEHAITERWKDELLTRLCRHLFGVSKNIDVVTAPTNWGKSTLITSLEKTLPGMVGRLEAYKAFSKQGDRFSQVSSLLSEKLLVFIDEAGQDDPERNAEVPPGALNTLTDDLLQVEKKFENNRTVPRLGTSILIGHTWAAVNASAQGVDTRVRWAYEAEEFPPMTEIERNLILSDEGIEYMRFWMVRRCRELWESSDNGTMLDDLTMSANNRKSVAAFKMARGDSLASSLLEEFEVGKPTDYVPSSAIKGALESDSDDKVGPKTIKSKVNIAFHAPFVRSGRATDRVSGKTGEGMVWTEKTRVCVIRRNRVCVGCLLRLLCLFRRNCV